MPINPDRGLADTKTAAQRCVVSGTVRYRSPRFVASHGGFLPNKNESKPMPRRNLAACQRAVVETIEQRILMTGTPTLTDIADFSSANGDKPVAGLLMDPSGNLYGTTWADITGAHRGVFEIVSGSNTLTQIARFSDTHSVAPASQLVMDASGNIFGTNVVGGANGTGYVYEIISGSHTITTLASFPTNGYGVGGSPSGNLVLDSHGNLFGATEVGGTNGDGSIFELAAGSSSITTLASFTGANGMNPYSGVVADSAGNLYGTTGPGGSLPGGTFYELAAGSSTITTLAVLNSFSTGSDPGEGVMIDAAGNLYASTYTGGASGNGSLLQYSQSRKTVSVLASFTLATGTSAVGNLTQDSTGNIYGVTRSGGANALGTVFELTAGSNIITPLVSFNGTNGSAPFSGVVMDSTGNLYGTTSAGGANGVGDVYQVSGRFSATKQVITAQPTGDVVAGSSQTVTVKLELSNGAIDSANQSVVTLTSNLSPYGGVIGGALSATAVNGVATFSGLTFKVAGNYLLTATATGFSNVVTNNIAVVSAPAAQLVVFQQPLDLVAGQTIRPVIAYVEDAFGNVVTTDNSTLNVATTDGSALVGTLNVSAIRGVATFSNVSSQLAGSHTLSFTDASLTAASTNSFLVTPGVSTQLAFIQQPQNNTAGGLVGAVIVAAEDFYGNVVPSDTTSVSLIPSEPLSFRGTVAQPLINGYALFNDVSSQTAGLHTLMAVDRFLTPTTSTPYITFAAPAQVLVITQQPATANYGQVIGSVTVEVRDAYDNLVTDDKSNITISGSSLSGTATVAAASGVAVFSNLIINTDGTEYLTASDGQLWTATSNGIKINSTAPAGGFLPALTITPSTLFPKSAATSKWLKVELISAATGKIAQTRTTYPKPNKSVVISNLGTNVSGIYNVVALDSLGHSAVLEQVTVLPDVPHALWFSSEPTVLDLDSIVAVSVLDKSGNVTTGADGSVVTLHSWLPKGTPGSAPILTGTLTAVVINGVATFTGLSMNQTGQAHLIARLGDLKPTVSDVFHSDSTLNESRKGPKH